MIPHLLWSLFSGCGGGWADPTREFGPPLPDGPRTPDLIHEPDGMGVWHRALSDDPELPEQAACVACHGPDPENFVLARAPEEAFHVKMVVRHGDLSCNHCHDDDRTLLHLANGESFDFRHVMRLCSQCHGTIRRDFDHGAHGGVEGYWDTRQGPRLRNNCADCHDPHSPATTQVMPVFRPRDRYMKEP